MLTALVTRISSPLGLNHIRPGGKSNHGPRKATLMDPTEDEGELFERSATFWLAYLCDQFACAATGWPSSLDIGALSST